MTRRLLILRRRDNLNEFEKVQEVIKTHLYGKPTVYEYEIISDTSHMTLELIHTQYGKDNYSLYSHCKKDANHERSNYFSDELTCDRETYHNLSKDRKINYTIYTNIQNKSDDRLDEYEFYVFKDSHIIIELEESADIHLFRKVYGQAFKDFDADLKIHIQSLWRKQWQLQKY